MAHRTIKQMWQAFVLQASGGDLARVPAQVRPAYYAGCHAMLEAMMQTMREPGANQATLSAAWQKWANELTRYSDDYNAGKV